MKAYVLLVFFFFQAEDGIRDATVTGVQTCALPILLRRSVKGMEVVEQRRAAREARLILGMRGGDPRDELPDAGRLLAAVLRVLHVDVVDDLGDRPERW